MFLSCPKSSKPYPSPAPPEIVLDGGGRIRPHLQTFCSVELCFPAKEQGWKTSQSAGGRWGCCLLTLRAASRSAPRSSITRTTSLWPIWDAIHRGAVPSCGKRRWPVYQGFQSLIHSRRTIRSQSKRSAHPKGVEKRRGSEHGTTGWRLQCLGDLKPFTPNLSYTKGLFPFLFRDRISSILDWMQTHYIPEDDRILSSPASPLGVLGLYSCHHTMYMQIPVHYPSSTCL